MLNNNHPSTLIIEPNPLMAKPYAYLPQIYDITRVTTLKTAFEQLIDNPPDIVCLSASYPIYQLLEYMSELQHFSRHAIIPLILVVDLDHRVNFIPGTFWGGELGILSSLSTEPEVLSMLERLLAHPK